MGYVPLTMWDISHYSACPMNELTRHLMLICVDAFLELEGGSESTLGRKIVNDGQFFTNLRSGRGFGVDKINQVFDYLAAHWPDGAERPICLTDHMALRQWEAANSYSCSAVLPRIVVPGACSHQEEAPG